MFTLADPMAYAWLGGLATVAGLMAYVFVRAIGMVAVGVVGAIIDRPEVRSDWASFLHDIRLRVTPGVERQV